MSEGEAEGVERGPLDVVRVMAALPHRYPLLLVDRVESL
ncbi:MAG TPA: 3-hydroxyacyl-[acyl-carrier-protein] dehydratase FabZ, partial [Sphingomonas sp.]|nr:3-hydroxyacyl-[acyl-carrier-protein] dehydratase FabZ [Sphingomonas sp.]